MTREDRDIWFPAKRYGWGRGLPVTWQGWAVTAAYFVVLLIGLFGIDPARQLPLFVAWMLGWSAVLVAVCWWKGERPRWRWGGRR